MFSFQINDIILNYGLCTETFLCDLKISFRIKLYINRLNKTNVFVWEPVKHILYKPDMTYV